jgi:tetratricopeptide (TPR) repeat protein
MQNVFLSYGGKDGHLVTRVAEDLKRARAGDIWCYELTSKYGVDFRREYCERVRSAQIFILFDSRHARTSRYVREEVDLCRSIPGVAMLVCLCEAHGEWRNGELFDGQNRLRYFDLVRYEQAIRDLCGHLGASYVPRFTMPRDQDFEQEVRGSADHFPLPQRQAILDKYQFFRSIFARDPAAAEAQLLVLIREHLDPIDAPVISAHLALGALRNEGRRYQAAEEAFAHVTLRTPDDPRGWAGKGAALFGLGRYREAAQAWARCLDCIAASGNPVHRQFEDEIRHNAASAHFEAGDPKAAWATLAPAFAGAERPTEDFVLAGKILLAAGSPQAGEMLVRGAQRVTSQAMIQSELIIDLVVNLKKIAADELAGRVLQRALHHYPYDVDLIRQWAAHHSECGNLDEAIAAYEKVLGIQPDNLRCLAEHALLLKTVGGRGGWRELVKKCLDAHALSPTDEYYLGLAHYLEGRIETARYHHGRSQRSALCAGWPFYDELVN